MGFKFFFLELQLRDLFFIGSLLLPRRAGLLFYIAEQGLHDATVGFVIGVEGQHQGLDLFLVDLVPDRDSVFVVSFYPGPLLLDGALETGELAFQLQVLGDEDIPVAFEFVAVVDFVLQFFPDFLQLVFLLVDQIAAFGGLGRDFDRVDFGGFLVGEVGVGVDVVLDLHEPFEADFGHHQPAAQGDFDEVEVAPPSVNWETHLVDFGPFSIQEIQFSLNYENTYIFFLDPPISDAGPDVEGEHFPDEHCGSIGFVF